MLVAVMSDVGRTALPDQYAGSPRSPSDRQWHDPARALERKTDLRQEQEYF